MGWGKGRKLSRRKFLRDAGVFAAGGSVIVLLGRRLTTTEAQTPDLPPIIEVLISEVDSPQIAPFSLGSGGETFTSPEVVSSFPFTYVALRWSHQEPEPAFELRTSLDGQQWSDWHDLQVEADHDENPRGEVFSNLASADRHSYVQYRVSLPGGSSAPRVGVVFINSADGPQLPRLETQALEASPALTAVQRPAVITREQWGADERLRLGNDGQEAWRRMYVPVKKVVVHHTATTNDYGDPAAEVRAVYAYHARTLGWGDIGYNALIGNDGQIYEGRYGREGNQYDPQWHREILSEDVAAGHATSHNYSTAGVSLIGNFQEFDLPENMYNALLTYAEFECRRHSIQPNAVSDFLRSSSEWTRGLYNVPGHRDVGSTECPGARVYALLPSIRKTLLERLVNGAAPTAHGIRMTNSSAPGDFAVSFGWRGADNTTPLADLEFSHYLEGWQPIPGSPEIVYLHGYTEERRPEWSEFAKGANAAFYIPSPGHYTFHVRARDRDGVISPFETLHTFLWEPDHQSFLPGLHRNP